MRTLSNSLSDLSIFFTFFLFIIFSFKHFPLLFIFLEVSRQQPCALPLRSRVPRTASSPPRPQMLKLVLKSRNVPIKQTDELGLKRGPKEHASYKAYERLANNFENAKFLGAKKWEPMVREKWRRRLWSARSKQWKTKTVLPNTWTIPLFTAAAVLKLQTPNDTLKHQTNDRLARVSKEVRLGFVREAAVQLNSKLGFHWNMERHQEERGQREDLTTQESWTGSNSSGKWRNRGEYGMSH